MDSQIAVVVCMLMLCGLALTVVVLVELRRLVLDMQRQNEIHTEHMVRAVARALTRGLSDQAKTLLYAQDPVWDPTQVPPNPPAQSAVTDIDTQGSRGQEWERPGYDDDLGIDPTDSWVDSSVNDREARTVLLKPGEDPLADLGLPSRDLGAELFFDPVGAPPEELAESPERTPTGGETE